MLNNKAPINITPPNPTGTIHNRGPKGGNSFLNLLSLGSMILHDSIQWTRQAFQIATHHVGMDFGRFHIRMSHEFLKGAHIDTVLQHMGGK
jgi:hypothetical protein